MHSFIRSFSLILLSFVFTLPLLGQETTFATRGTTEIAGTVAFSSVSPVEHGSTGDATSIFTIAPEIGYFITDGFELGFNPGVSFVMLPGVTVASSGGHSTTFTQLFLAPAYNFRVSGSKVTPFVEVPLGYTSVSGGGSTSGFSWGIKGGVKVTPVEHLVLNISTQYLMITMKPSGVTERYGFNYFSFGLGVGGYF